MRMKNKKLKIFTSNNSHKFPYKFMNQKLLQFQHPNCFIFSQKGMANGHHISMYTRNNHLCWGRTQHASYDEPSWQSSSHQRQFYLPNILKWVTYGSEIDEFLCDDKISPMKLKFMHISLNMIYKIPPRFDYIAIEMKKICFLIGN